MTTAVMIVAPPLNTQVAIRILSSAENYNSIQHPPPKPKGAELYLYDYTNFEEKKSELVSINFATCKLVLQTASSPP